MDRYIGMDVHQASCTVAVIGPSGKRLKNHVVDTDATVLVELMKGIAGDKHLCMEEGELSQWLYEVLRPHVKELVVTQMRDRVGNKNDALDAWMLADMLRRQAVPMQVFKTTQYSRPLRDAVTGYEMVTRDMVRAKNRLRAVFRSNGVHVDEHIYDPEERKKKLKLLPPSKAQLGTELGQLLDATMASRDRLESWLHDRVKESIEVRRLQTVPGLGSIRAAQVVAIVVSPERFRTKRQFWSYCGLGIVHRSTNDWERGPQGRWKRTETTQARGLNRNRNPRLKQVFRSAAKTVVDQMPNHPLYKDYERMLEAGTKPNLAQLTLARRIAAATLAIWKHKENYDPAKHRRKDAA